MRESILLPEADELEIRRRTEPTTSREEHVPFTKTAEEVGHKIVSNIVMLGFLGAAIDIVPHELLEETTVANIPEGTEDLNRRALAAGRALYENHAA
jgi:Pyruvate/2-oxoacid:ferredoxin oxidoreductase gamma subunit